MSIATVISFCSNDYRFLSKCVQEASIFSDQVIIPVCDHFFDGSPENRDLLNWAYHSHPNCEFVEFPYSHKTVYPTYLRYQPGSSEWTHHWHSFGRLIGFYHVRPDIEWVLFLDCDEILDGNRFSDLIKNRYFSPFEAVRLACYYYVLKPNLRTVQIFPEYSLLARRTSLKSRFFHHTAERLATFRWIEGAKKIDVRGSDGLPLVHHYSWVRPEEECHHKSNTWGHRLDLDWKAIIEETFRKQGIPFGIDLEFQEVDQVYFDPLSVEIPKEPAPMHSFSNVKTLKIKDYMRLELEQEGLM